MTFELDEALQRRLKAAAAERGVTVRDLLEEGAKIVLSRHGVDSHRDALQKRAEKALADLKKGLFSSDLVQADRVDELLYAAEPKGKYE